MSNTKKVNVNLLIEFTMFMWFVNMSTIKEKGPLHFYVPSIMTEQFRLVFEDMDMPPYDVFVEETRYLYLLNYKRVHGRNVHWAEAMSRFIKSGRFVERKEGFDLYVFDNLDILKEMTKDTVALRQTTEMISNELELEQISACVNAHLYKGPGINISVPLAEVTFIDVHDVCDLSIIMSWLDTKLRLLNPMAYLVGLNVEGNALVFSNIGVPDFPIFPIVKMNDGQHPRFDFKEKESKKVSFNDIGRMRGSQPHISNKQESGKKLEYSIVDQFGRKVDLSSMSAGELLVVLNSLV